MTTIRPGKLIVFEGIDGTGKSTQIKLLKDHLENQGYQVVATYEPTNGVYGRKIRELYQNRQDCTPQEELELFILDRKEHVDTILLPALTSGRIVLCDRYYLSTAAYQGANGFSPEEILKLNDFAPEPDIALLFEQPIETSLTRITQHRGETLNDFEQAETLRKVSEIFKSLDFPFIRRVSSDDSIENVHLKVIDIMSTLLESSQIPAHTTG